MSRSRSRLLISFLALSAARYHGGAAYAARHLRCRQHHSIPERLRQDESLSPGGVAGRSGHKHHAWVSLAPIGLEAERKVGGESRRGAEHQEGSHSLSSDGGGAASELIPSDR